MFKKSSEDRKKESLGLLDNIGINVDKDLPVIDTSNISMRTKEEIAKRAVSCLFSIQASLIDIKDYDYSFFEDKLIKFCVKDCLTDQEKLIFEGKMDKEDLKLMPWKYESYWILCWVLGFVSKLNIPNECCDFDKAIDFIFRCNNFEDFISKVKLIDAEKVLDEYDFTYRLNNVIDDDSNKDNHYILRAIVSERYMALKWVLYPDAEWL
ncbi:DUF4272 domain-containing protein [Brachyspira pulli]|uniref:DUF4272 domain-containing protein n=1 Tax=Brachyspira pulli TaxID=310721 RepID=UPI003003E09F